MKYPSQNASNNVVAPAKGIARNPSGAAKSRRIITRQFIDSQKLTPQNVSKAWANLLAQFHWQWFCTLTFRHPPTHESAAKTFKHFTNIINSGIYGKYWRKFNESIYWALALEYHKSGVIHFHALLGDLQNLNLIAPREDAKKLWEELAGWSRIAPIDDQVKAVTKYISKYVAKGGYIDTSDNLKNFQTIYPGIDPYLSDE